MNDQQCNTEHNVKMSTILNVTNLPRAGVSGFVLFNISRFILHSQSETYAISHKEILT